MRQNEAVLHIKVKNPVKVNQLAGHVHTTMTTNKALFPLAVSTLEVLRSENDKLGAMILEDNGSKLARETILAQTDVALGVLRDLVFYVNKAAQGDKVIVLSSGFDCTNDPVLITEVPAKAVIRRISDGATSCSIKVYADAVPGADRYKLEIASDVNNPVYVVYTDHAVVTGLEAKDLTRGQEILVRVTAGNSKGWGDPSDPSSFIPR